LKAETYAKDFYNSNSGFIKSENDQKTCNRLTAKC